MALAFGMWPGYDRFDDSDRYRCGLLRPNNAKTCTFTNLALLGGFGILSGSLMLAHAQNTWLGVEVSFALAHLARMNWIGSSRQEAVRGQGHD